MRSFLALLCLIMLSACGGREDVGGTREMAVGACMKKVPTTLGSYFDGRASEQETDAVFECIHDSLRLFTERTTGEAQGVYTQEEIRRFVERFILEGRKLNPSLVNEALVLKSALFGGTPDKLTHAEIESFRKFLSSLKEASQIMRADFPLSLNTTTEAAIERVRIGTDTLGRALMHARSTYSLDHAFQFVGEIQALIHSPTLEYWLKRRSLIETGLRVLISNTPGQINPSDWKPILITAYQAFKMGRAARVWANEPSGFFDTLGFAAWERVFESTTDLISSAIDRTPERSLKATDLLEWLRQLHQAELASIQPEVFEQFLIFKKYWIGSPSLDLTKLDMQRCKLWVVRFHESGAKLKLQSDNPQAIGEVLDNWADWLSESASPLPLSDLKNFLRAIQTQFHSEEVSLIAKNFDAFTAVYQWSMGTDRTTIERSDWKPLMKLLMRALDVKRSASAVIALNLNQKNLFEASASDEIQLATQSTLELLDFIQKQNQNQKLGTTTLKALMPPSAHQWLKFKTPIAGGDPQYITVTELKKTVTFLKDLRLALIPIVNLMPMKITDSESKLNQLNSVLGKLGIQLGKMSGQLSWPLLSGLAKESPFFVARETWIKDAVTAFALPDPNKIAPQDWSTAIKSFQLGIQAFSKLKKLSDSGQLIFWGQGLTAFEGATVATLDWLDHVTQTRAGKSIRIGLLKSIVAGLEPSEMPIAVQKDTLNRFVGPLVARLMNGINLDSLSQAEINNIGITPTTVSRLRAELDRYASVQKSLPRLFALTECIQNKKPDFFYPNTETSAFLPFDCMMKDLVTQTNPLDLQIWKTHLLILLRNPSLATTLGLTKTQFSALKELVFYAHPMFKTSGDQLYFPKLNESLSLTINSLSQIHWSRVLVKNIIRGYAKEEARAKATSGITEDEMKLFIDDVRQLGLELFIIDPLTQNIHGKRFFEGTHLTPSARGLTLIDPSEFSELIIHLKSGGAMAVKTNQILAERCPHLNGNGYGYPFINSECYRNVFFSHADVFWKNIPNMSQFYKSLAETEKKLFRDLLEFCADAYAITVDSKWMTSADTRTFMVLLQYIESIVQRFDLNRSGTLDLGSWTMFSSRVDEVSPAFTIFKSKIAEVAKDVTNEYILDKAFTYMLAKGEIPVEGTSSFNWWLSKPQSFQSNKLNILKVFAEIQRSLNTKPDEPLNTY